MNWWIVSYLGQAAGAHIPVFMKGNIKQGYMGRLLKDYPGEIELKDSIKDVIKTARKPQAFKPGDEWLPGAKRRPFVGMFWQGRRSLPEHAEALKLRPLGRRVVH